MRRCLGEAIETGQRSTNALGLVEEALRQAQLDRAQIECLAIGLGPGSYNGIRLAIALAQGWQLARPVKLLGISSVECLAAQAQAEGIFGRVEVVIDAQRNEFYLAGYDLSPNAARNRAAAPGHPGRGPGPPAGGRLIGPEVSSSSRQPHSVPPGRHPGPTGPGPHRLRRRRSHRADLPARNPLRQSPAPANPPRLSELQAKQARVAQGQRTDPYGPEEPAPKVYAALGASDS